MTEWDDLARGLVAGMLEKQVKLRGSVARWVGIAIVVLGLLGAILFGGFVRGLGITMVLVGLIIILLVALVRALALGTIRKFATPQSIAEKRDEIEVAMDKADLPTGPVTVIRFLYRLRKGVGTEVQRLDKIMDDLRDELASTEDFGEEDTDGELEGGPSTPELPQ